MTWDKFREKIENVTRKDDVFLSYKKWLLAAADKAEEWGIDPEHAIESNLSNLYDITPELRHALRWENKGEMENLFLMAHRTRNAELRRALHKELIQSIVIDVDATGLKITLTPEQLEIVKRKTRNKFDFRHRKPALAGG